MSSYDRFVLIDDNDADNVFHEIMIRRAGFEGDVLVFENGLDALSFFEKDEAQISTCIFLDINMPMMDGFEVAQRMTPLLERKPWVILVMLTSSGNLADRARALSIASIKGYVTKPLDVAKIQEIMADSF